VDSDTKALVARLHEYGDVSLAAGAQHDFYAAAALIEALQRDLRDERRLADGLGEALRRLYEDDDATGVDEILEEWDDSRGID